MCHTPVTWPNVLVTRAAVGKMDTRKPQRISARYSSASGALAGYEPFSLFVRCRVANPCVANDATTKPQICEGGQPMVSVKYSQAIRRVYSNDGRWDSSALLDTFNEAKKPFSAAAYVEVPRRINAKDVVFNKNLDRVARKLIKKASGKGKIEFVPKEAGDIIQSVEPKVTVPLFGWMRRELIRVRPSTVIPDDGQQPRIKHLNWHIRKHVLGSVYVIHGFLIKAHREPALSASRWGLLL